MKFLILLVALYSDAGIPTMKIFSSFETMFECQQTIKGLEKRYPEEAKSMRCLPVVTEGYNDPI